MVSGGNHSALISLGCSVVKQRLTVEMKSIVMKGKKHLSLYDSVEALHRRVCSIEIL